MLPQEGTKRAFVIQELGDPHRRRGTSRSLMRTRERFLNHPESGRRVNRELGPAIGRDTSGQSYSGIQSSAVVASGSA
jgi:hypothetical protein